MLGGQHGEEGQSQVEDEVGGEEDRQEDHEAEDRSQEEVRARRKRRLNLRVFRRLRHVSRRDSMGGRRDADTVDDAGSSAQGG